MKGPNPQKNLQPEQRLALGNRLHELRQAADLTIREVAAKARVDKNTVVNIEKGRPVRRQTLQRVCTVFGVFADPAVLGAKPSVVGHSFAVHHSADRQWHRITVDQPDEPSVLATSDLVQDASARMRLGTLGLAQQFIQRLHCSLPKGRIRAAILEVYGPSGWSHQLGGEAFFYCLRGSVRFFVGSDSFVLQTGSSATIDRTVEHMHEPSEPVAPGTSAPLLLYVQVD